MAEEGEEWKEEGPEVWSPNRLSGIPFEPWPREWEFSHLAILNEAHEVVPVRSLKEWGTFIDQIGKRRVAETTVNGFWISTVFLGIDHGFGMGPSLWFETMIFKDEENPPPAVLSSIVERLCGNAQWRYATWQEAVEGHETVVEMFRLGIL